MWICDLCGTKYGKYHGGVSTYHIGKCDWCGQDKAVTEDRDYGYCKPLEGKEKERWQRAASLMRLKDAHLDRKD